MTDLSLKYKLPNPRRHGRAALLPIEVWTNTAELPAAIAELGSAASSATSRKSIIMGDEVIPFDASGGQWT